MKLTRVVVAAPVTSFRHPFFVTGKQPTSLFPPPSTIHGHCASALGRWPDPTTFVFGLHFTFRAKTQDLEHEHLAEALGAKAKTFIQTPRGSVRATTAITVQPVLREFLFDTQLTLYLADDIGASFRSPVFPVVLGRSQDLAEVISVKSVVLERRERVRLEHTLLPFTLRPCVPAGSTVLLTRFITEPPVRHAEFERYIALHDSIFVGGDPKDSRTFLRMEGADLENLWADSDFVDEEGFARGVYMHRLRPAA